jgi:two-component system, LytTR family, response regulator
VIRVLIVDDEAIARRRLQRLLRSEPDVDVIGECSRGRDAVASIRAQRPDIVLLDVQLPDIDGFGVVSAVGTDRMPAVIFITAYDVHALRAFEVHATDYLLKPFDAARFQRAFARARQQLDQASSAQIGRRLRALLEGVMDDVHADTGTPETAQRAGASARARYLTRLTVKRDGRVMFVRVGDIDWFEAEGNYVRVHAGKSAMMVRTTMQKLEASLDPSAFARIHRTVIVNVDRIQELQPWFAGNYVVILRDGTRLRLSRTFRDRLPLRDRRPS